jgi:c-di-GMP-binding flagellar brake protein YcgR
LPKINQYLYIQVESIDEEESQQVYKSRIADIQDDSFGIEIPLSEKTGKSKRLYTGDQISAHYISEGGVKNYFQTTVLGYREDTIRQVIIKKPDPDSITKVQRRNYLRVPTELEVAVLLSGHIQIAALTDDLSGGGLSFICEGKYPIQTKDNLHCWLLLNFKNETIDHASSKGEVIRVKKLEMGRQLVMVNFTEIHNTDRQKIIKYCFERQLDLRKR